MNAPGKFGRAWAWLASRLQLDRNGSTRATGPRLRNSGGIDRAGDDTTSGRPLNNVLSEYAARAVTPTRVLTTSQLDALGIERRLPMRRPHSRRRPAEVVRARTVFESA